MVEGLLPPFAEQRGPRVGDDEVVAAFARCKTAGFSARFHVEGTALLADRDVPAALRLAPEAILVRLDLPDELEAVRPVIEAGLASEGMALLDADTALGVPVALQFVGLRLSSWDLWGTDLDDAFAVLRQAAAGEWA